MTQSAGASRRGEPGGETGSIPVLRFERGENSASTASMTPVAKPVRAPILIPIAAIALSVIGAVLALTLGWRTPPIALGGWVLSGIAAALLITWAQSLDLSRSASSRYQGGARMRTLMRVAIGVMLVSVIACCIVIAPWVARW